MDVLPSGPRPHDPTGLLSRSRFSEFLNWAQDYYDQVLIDGTPILVASDAAIVGRVADGLVLVIQPEKNHRRAVLRAADEIHDANLNLIGLVINRISTDARQGYGSGYGYGYGYGYGEAYGDFDDIDENDQTKTS
jgi:Mrp family chromosome partitioning ATPase